MGSDDNTMPANHAIKTHIDLIAEAMAKIGRPGATLEQMRESFEKAGFVDVKAVAVKQPYGPWPKDRNMKKLGAFVMMNCESAFHSYGMAAFTRILGMSGEEAERICDEAKRIVRNKNFHVYHLM